MTLLIFYVLVALTVSFTCSILEAVLLSVTPGYVALMEKEKHPAAPRLRALKENIDRPLSAILSLNTIAHTAGAAGAGAQAAHVFGSAAVGTFSAVLTFLILVTSEIIPKTLGAVNWRRLAPLVVRVLRVLVISMWPLVKLSEWLTTILTRGHDDATVSRDEIAALADEGQKEGVVQEGESRVMKNLFRLSALRARDIMTPDEHLVALSAATVVGEVMELSPELRFSRLPLYEEDASGRRFTGYALKDDILTHAVHEDPARPLAAMSRELLTVPESMPLPTVFDLMVERREHIALALEENGGTAGLVTMEDIIETILGMEIFDEVDDEDRIHELARAHWTERARRLGRVSDATGGTATLGITGGTPPRGTTM